MVKESVQQKNINCILMNPVVQAVNFADQVIQTTLSDMPKHGHLYLLHGEHHSSIPDKAFQILLIDKISDKSKLNIAHEIAADTILNTIRTTYGFEIKKDRKRAIEKCDQSGLTREMRARYSIGLKESPLQHRMLYSLMYNKKIHLSNVDSYIKDGKYIDIQNDPLFEKEIQNDKEIESISPYGVHLRNKTMVTRTLRSAETTKSKTTLLITGAAHVGGDNKLDFPYNESLCALFNKQIQPQDRLITLNTNGTIHCPIDFLNSDKETNRGTNIFFSQFPYEKALPFREEIEGAIYFKEKHLDVRKEIHKTLFYLNLESIPRIFTP
jgi:hypothetical protein